MISRWVDAHGQVHYGDTLPPDAPDNAADVGPIQSSTPEQKQQADQQLQQYRDFLKQPVAPQGGASQTAASSQKPATDDSCAGQWARYNAAVACTAPYHVAGGGLKQDVAQNCPVVPQPQCAPPGP
jgi:cytoskeletal protein RodZ